MTTYYTERGGLYYRAGLVYEPLEDDQRLWQYEPDGPFFVDGIRYETPNGNHVAPMIELLRDGGRGGVFRYMPEVRHG